MMVETTNSQMEEEVMKVELLAKKRELESNLNKSPHDKHTRGNDEKVVDSSSVNVNDNQSY